MRHFFYFVRPALFYLLLFAAYRQAFLLLYVSREVDILPGELHLAFLYGLRLDLAITAYILFFPFLLWAGYFERVQTIFEKTLRVYHVFAIFLVHLVSFSNLVIYNFWGSLINWRALSYLDNPKEAAASVSFLSVVLLAALIVALVWISVLIFQKFFYRRQPALPRMVPRIFLTVFFAGLLILAARGGWQLLPINESVAYYSSASQLNDAANNSLWHLGHSAKVAASQTNPFHTMDDKQAKGIVDFLYATAAGAAPFSIVSDTPATDSLNSDTLTSDTVTTDSGLLIQKNPNVVLIILESFSADLLGCMGAKQSAAPFLDSLSAQSLLFTNIYSSGFRTDQGLPSLLSGFPATPVFSIISYPEKSVSLPSLVREFKQKGYQSSFYYGGTGNFRNMKAYCYHLGFEKYTDQSGFSADLPSGKWGIHDEYVFLRQAKELGYMQQPFFSVVMSLSNHEPYDVPMQPHFPVTDDVSRFRNSAFYTDASLRKYFQFASRQKWFDSTLFVFVADHGHHYPEKRPMSGPEAHHLPLLFYGKVLNPECYGHQLAITGNHHDLPATLLHLLDMDATEFSWSKDLLNANTRSFAYYEQDDGFGWVEPGGWVYYSVLQKRTIGKSDKIAEEQRMVQQGSAYLQTLYDQFLKY